MPSASCPICMFLIRPNQRTKMLNLGLADTPAHADCVDNFDPGNTRPSERFPASPSTPLLPES